MHCVMDVFNQAAVLVRKEFDCLYKNCVVQECGISEVKGMEQKRRVQ